MFWNRLLVRSRAGWSACAATWTAVSELRDPHKCILTSGPIMAASYLLTDTQGKCSGIAEDIRNQLRQEQADCVKYVPYPHPISGGSPDGGSCSVQRTVVVFRGNRTCFSTLTIIECRGSCQPKNVNKSKIETNWKRIKSNWINVSADWLPLYRGSEIGQDHGTGSSEPTHVFHGGQEGRLPSHYLRPYRMPGQINSLKLCICLSKTRNHVMLVRWTFLLDRNEVSIHSWHWLSR